MHAIDGVSEENLYSVRDTISILNRKLKGGEERIYSWIKLEFGRISLIGFNLKPEAELKGLNEFILG